jgi:peptide/nickel transport system substrate-binding protein
VLAVDGSTVDVVLAKPDPTLPAAMASLGGAIINPKFIDNSDAILQGAVGVGTGPYKVVSFTPTTKIVMERNDSYWNKAAIDGAPKTFEYDVVADGNARLNGLKTGVYQGIQWGGTPGLGGSDGLVATDHHFVQNTTVGSVMFGLGWSFAAKPLDDPRVRMAMAEAVDIDTLVGSLLKDEMGCAAPRPSQLPFVGQLGYDASIQAIPYDPNGAKALLAAAGYPDGKGIPKLTIASTTASNDVIAAQAFIPMWAKLGIDVTLDQQPSRVYALAEFQSGKAQLMTVNIAVGGTLDPAGAVDGGILPPPLVDNSDAGKQYKDLAAQAKATLDNNQRQQLYSQMSKLVNQNSFFVPMCRTNIGYATTTSIDGIKNSWWLSNGIVKASTIRVRK